MSIVENSVSELNDVILVQAFTPIFGVVSITGYTDTTIGETLTRSFKKEFSYSIDGIFFSNWIPLTNADLQQIVVKPTDAFYVNYKYTRVGTDETGTLSFVDITLNGVFSQPLCENYFILPKSIFKNLFCYNPAHAHLCAIFTNKLFEKGILPEYITRGEGLNPQVDDEDFLAFWGTVSCFYALVLLFAKNIENFETIKEYLEDYLKQRDVFFCSDDITLQDLQYIKANYFDEIRQRGTIQIFVPKNNDKEVDGEFLRLICYKANNDEFLFDLYANERIGWWLGKSSPSYKGTALTQQMIKTKEVGNNFLSLNNYITFNGNGGTISLQADGDKSVAVLQNVPNTFSVGFTYDMIDPQATNVDNAIIVDENLDYEVSFWVKTNLVAPNLTFGIIGIDKNNNYSQLLNAITGFGEAHFFEKKSLNQPNVYYFVRGIIYNKHKALLTADEARLNIGFGQQLKFDGAITNRIIPIVVLDRTSNPDINSKLYIWGLKVKPLVKGAVANKVYDDFTEVPTLNNKPLYGAFSTCLLTTRNMLHIVYKNNNDTLQQSDIENITRDKLIPYNSVLKTTIIS